MPEYLAPGVYVEEVSFRAKSIEGVSTTTTGFVGPTRYGPTDLEPDVITSLVEFERTYGDRLQFQYAKEKDITVADDPMHNYMWHAVRAFFEQGGKRLYVQRVFRPLVDPDPTTGEVAEGSQDGRANDGRAFATLPKTPATAGQALTVRARFPGAAGSRRVRVTLRVGSNVLTPDRDTGKPRVVGVRDRDVVCVRTIASPFASPPACEYYVAERFADSTTGRTRWRFTSPTAPALDLETDFHATTGPDSDEVRIVTATVGVLPADPDALSQVWTDLPLDPAHQLAGSADSIFDQFADEPENLSLARSIPIVIEKGSALTDGVDVLEALFAAGTDLRGRLSRQGGQRDLRGMLGLQTDPRDPSTDLERSVDVLLEGGNDGRRPRATDYEGAARPDKKEKTGLKSLEDIEDISIVAAPGSTFRYEDGYRDDAATIQQLLIGHAQLMRYRIAVLDSGEAQSISQVRDMRSQLDSKYAAFYYPWVRILDPVTQRDIHLPPSGFVTGIYARNDIERAVYKAPANEVVTLAIGFETLLNKGQQEVLNPEGINCFRFFEGRGYRLWGARTISSDPEWKYVNLRRYFIFLEHSIDRGTQWAVFEPNGEALWANVRRTIEDFLFDQWQKGALLGDKPEKAYFVKCDRTTMTQNDLDNGRLVCLIGVAPLRPAEFVIFQIGQWTADRRG
jgi:phage tail sheath protein FI